MRNLKVLILDDERDYCMIMKSYFRSRNYEVLLAYTLQDGLKVLAEEKPDILLLDNNLPDGKGWECVDDLVEKYPGLRIYLISAYHQTAAFTPNLPNVTVWEKPIQISLLNEAFA